MKYEWRKHDKNLYSAKKTPALVIIPVQNYIMLSGKGDPNDADFSNRVAALYALAYAIKMGYKAAAAKESQSATIHDYAVYTYSSNFLTAIPQGIAALSGQGAAALRSGHDGISKQYFTVEDNCTFFKEKNLLKKALAFASAFSVSLIHFRYHFSDTKKDRHTSKFSNISFASFDNLFPISLTNVKAF